MKLSRLLHFAVFAATAPSFVLGQSPAPSPSASPVPTAAAAGSPSPDASHFANPAAAPRPDGATSDAAGAVPLPEQPAAGGSTLDKPIQLMPGGAAPNIPKPGKSEAGPATEPGAQQPAGKTDLSNTFQAEADLHARIRMRQLYTRVSGEPSSQDEWAAAHQAKTDPERRALLKLYYTHLYDKMAKLDSSLAERIEARKTSTLWGLEYPRLEPDKGQDEATLPGSPEQPGVPPR